MQFPYIISGETLTAVVDGRAFTIASDHPSWGEVTLGLKQENLEAEELIRLLDVAKAVTDFGHGSITVRDGEVFAGEQPVHNVVTERILQFMNQGLPHQPLVAFLVKLMDNPSRNSVEQLYKFLEHRNLPVTPEGNFLAYKSIRRDNWKDWHSNRYENTVGTIHEMQRNQVSDDATVACSYGFHVGSLQYASDFNRGENQRVVIVEVDPADVVSVPHDCEAQKVRTCKYRVVCEYQGPLEAPLHYADDPYRTYEYDLFDDEDEELYEEEELEEEGEDFEETYGPAEAYGGFDRTAAHNENVPQPVTCPNCGEQRSDRLHKGQDDVWSCLTCGTQF
jgi:hypothetical protein